MATIVMYKFCRGMAERGLKMNDNQIVLTFDEFEDFTKDSEVLRILRDLFARYKNPDPEIIRSILEVEFECREGSQ